MLVPFDSLPETSRVWIYQSNRSFTDEELQQINHGLDVFLKQWTAHGAELKTGYEVRYKRFIIIGLDQSQTAATGCSIDESVKFIQELESRFDVDLLDKMNVSYKQGEFIAYKNLKDFRKMAKDRAVSANTVVFNNLVNNKAEYLSDWEVPASESWHNRFLN